MRRLKVMLTGFSVIFLIFAFSFAVVGAETQQEAIEFTYTVTDGKATITGCNGDASGHIVIPEAIDGYEVTAIGSNAFSSRFFITDVTIPKSVRTIGYNAFFSLLKGVHIESIEQWFETEFENEGFFYSYRDAGLYIDGVLQEHIVIPEGVTAIPDYAFYLNNYIKSITIPSSVEYLGMFSMKCSKLENVYLESVEAWFNTCFATMKADDWNYHTYGLFLMEKNMNYYIGGELLVDLVIPESVTEIPSMAFYRCKSLESVTFHNGVTKVFSDAFWGCSNLKEVYVPDLATWTNACAISHYNTFETIYIGNEPVVNLVVPEGTERLPAYCFYNYDKLESITIKSGVKYIGARSFEGCDGLRDVYVDSLKSWLDISFDGSYANPMTVAENLYIAGENVENLVIDESVTAIPENAFANMTSIKTVTIHDKLTSIGEGAFENCTGIESVYAPSLEAWLAVDFASGIANPLGSGVKLYINGELLEVLEIPENITTIKPYAFSGYSYLKRFNITGAPLTIGNSAFSKDCAGMEIHAETLQDWFNVKADFSLFPGWCNPMKFGAVLYIGGKQPEEIVVPESVKSIPAFAFQNCKSLKKITIPATTTIGTDAFSGCSLEEVVYGSLTKKQEAVAEITSSPLNNTKIKKIVVGYGIKSVGEEAFKGTGLKEAVIYDGLESIGESAFYGSAITEITIPVTVKTVGKMAFGNNTSLEKITFGTKGCGKSKISIAYRAFYNCSALKEVVYNTGVYSTANRAFEKCGSLENVYVNDLEAYLAVNDDDHFGESYYSPLDGGCKNFYINGTQPTDLVIPEGVTVIPAYAFYECIYLESITLPESLLSIGDCAFVGCKNIKEIIIPDNVRDIGEFAFAGCRSAKTLKLGAGVQNVGFDAFVTCPSLEVIYMGPDLIGIGAYAFDKNNNIKLVVYPGSEEAWLKLLKANKNQTGLESVAVYYRYNPASMFAPENLTATSDTEIITLKWNKIDGVSGYRIYVKMGDSWKTVRTISKNVYTVTGITPGTKYTFAVKAYINTGSLVLWSPNYTTISTASRAIEPEKAIATQSESAIKLSWSASKGATGYRIYYKSGDQWKVTVSSTSSTSHTFKSLKAGAKYTFAIRPYIKTESGVVWSSYIKYTTATKPAAVTAKATSTSSGRISLSWNQVNGSEGYQIWYKKNDGSYKLYKTVGASTKSMSFSGLTKGTRYTFAVRAGIKTSGGNIYGAYKTSTVTVR